MKTSYVNIYSMIALTSIKPKKVIDMLNHFKCKEGIGSFNVFTNTFKETIHLIIALMQALGVPSVADLENWLCATTSPSRRIGNFTSQLPTMFCILNSRNFA